MDPALRCPLPLDQYACLFINRQHILMFLSALEGTCFYGGPLYETPNPLQSACRDWVKEAWTSYRYLHVDSLQQGCVFIHR
jgi:hypothetical protein